MRPLLTLLAALALYAVACSDEPQPPASTTAPAATATFTPPPAGPAATAVPVTPGPVQPALAVTEPAAVLADGQPVDFKLCRRIDGFQRPPLDAMQDLFTDRRFGDGARPYPGLFTYYISNFIYDPIPTAASGDTQRLGFSGVTYNIDKLETFCTEADLRSLGADFAWVAMESVGYRITDVRYADNGIVLRAEPEPGTWQSTVFPYPPQPRGTLSFQSLQVVGPDGVKLYEYSSGDQWDERIHYDPDGNLVYVIMGTAVSRDSTPVEVPAAGATLDLFSAGADAALAILDPAGHTVVSAAWNRSADIWRHIQTITLEPGRYTLRCLASIDNWCEVTLIAAGQPLPPGATP